MIHTAVMMPLPIATVAVSSGSGAANLLDPDPKLVWADAAVGAAAISIDLGADASIDTVAAIGGSWSADASWAVTYGDGASGSYTAGTLMASTPVREAGRNEVPYPAWTHRAAGPVTARYVRLSVVQGGAGPLTLGCVAVGQAQKPAFGREVGGGRGLGSTGSKSRLPGGGFARVPGAIFPKFSWTFGDLTDAETLALYRSLKAVGDQEPIVVIEDVAATVGRAEVFHWGLLESVDTFDRRDPDLTRWGFTIEDWV